MSMAPKQILPRDQMELERIGYACRRTAALTNLSQFLGDINNIKNWLSDLHNRIVAGEKSAPDEPCLSCVEKEEP